MAQASPSMTRATEPPPPRRLPLGLSALSLSALRCAPRCALFCAFLLLCGGCSTVEYYEKQNFGDAAMKFEADPSEVHFQAKGFYSMEGSAGGIGDSAGGGCGCY